MTQITAFNLNEQQAEGLKLLIADAENHGVKLGSGKTGAPVYAPAFKWLLENYAEITSARGGRPKTGPGDELMARIHETVTEQMRLNETTDKTVTVGRGKNSVVVRYEQRAITDRWIRDAANANAETVALYMAQHAEEIERHNAWLIESCGYPTEIENFNRRTGKASVKAEG